LERTAGQQLYLALVTAGLVVLLAGAWWGLAGREIPLTRGIIEVLVLAFVAAAITGLHWLRPHRTLYVFGVLCVVVAFLGIWLGSPTGGWWMGNALNASNNGPYARRIFSFLFLLFPIGWFLLATSVANWKLGVATYLAPGVILVLITVAIAGPPGYGPGQIPVWLLPYFLFGWPAAMLQALGAFGYTFG
jgi:hypothetical protein